MTMLYTTRSKKAILNRGTANYLYRVPEAVIIMTELFNGPAGQKDIVTTTTLSAPKVKSILAQLFRRGIVTKHRRQPTSMTYYYDLTCIARLWMIQHYADQLPVKTLPKTGVTA